MKTLNETIKEVLDDLQHTQFNIGSDTARATMAKVIAATLIAGGVKNEVNDDNGV
jgi:hypothetical protein